MNGYEYVYGSTARKRVEENPYVINRIHRKRIRVKNFQKSKKKILLYIGVAFIIFLFVMIRYAVILNMNYEIAKSNAQYKRILAENSALHMQINKKTNLVSLHDKAVNELGMVEANGDNVTYFKVEIDDKKVVNEEYKVEREFENKDPITGMIERLRLFLNIK